MRALKISIWQSGLIVPHEPTAVRRCEFTAAPTPSTISPRLSANSSFSSSPNISVSSRAISERMDVRLAQNSQKKATENSPLQAPSSDGQMSHGSLQRPAFSTAASPPDSDGEILNHHHRDGVDVHDKLIPIFVMKRSVAKTFRGDEEERMQL